MAQLADIQAMTVDQVLPSVLAELEHPPTLYDRLPVVPDAMLEGKTKTIRVPRNINSYVVNPLPDATAVVPVDTATDSVDIVGTRYAVAERITQFSSLQALSAWMETVLSNMLTAMYEDVVTRGYAAIAATPGIGLVGTDNTAITRDVIQDINEGFDNAKIPMANRLLSVTPQSESDIASIPDYNRAFSNNGVIPAEAVRNVGGNEVIKSPAATMPDDGTGKANLAIWTPSVVRAHFDEMPTIMSQRNVKVFRQLYRGIPFFLWIYEIDENLGDFVMAMSTTHGIAVVRESGVIKVLGR